jgi:hypothetical protein
MKKFEVELFNSSEIEPYEENERNIIKVRVQLPSGEMIESSDYRVEVSLSEEAMLGLAIQLIRAVKNKDSKAKLWHLHPSELDFASQILGVYLHPKSCELLLVENDFGDLQTVLESS